MKRTHIRIVAVLTATAVGGFAIAQTQSDSVEYRVDGWCLSHERDAVERYPKNSRVSGAIPSFRAPSDFPLLSTAAEPDATGLVVSFTKKGPRIPSGLLLSEGSYMMRGCGLVPTEFGLSQFVNENAQNCAITKHFDSYEPTVRDDTFWSVRVNCSTNTLVHACRMSLLLPDQWKASISLPKKYLTEWRTAARVAQDYFKNNLDDCGES